MILSAGRLGVRYAPVGAAAAAAAACIRASARGSCRYEGVNQSGVRSMVAAPASTHVSAPTPPTAPLDSSTLPLSKRSPPPPRHISHVAVDDDAGQVVVHWTMPTNIANRGRAAVSRFPYVYLRDHCESNYSAFTNQKTTLLKDLDLNVHASGVTIGEDGLGVHVKWADGRESHYTARWLEEHCFSEGNRIRRRYSLYKTKPRLWDNKYMQANLKIFKFSELVSDDVCLHDWLEEVETVGLAVIEDAPPVSGLINVLSDRVTFFKTTHFGKTFEVKSKTNPSNLAYTDAGLALHTDLPQCEYAPCIQLLHCIKQSSTGGDSIFTDGFQAADVLKDQCPEYFKVLSTTRLDFADVGNDYIEFYMYGKQCTIELDSYGDYERIFVNNTTRSSFLDINLEDVPTFYAALSKFNQLLNSDDLLFTYKMKKGDIVCFINTRILHGRNAYSCDRIAGGERYLQGNYFDTDQFRSKLRVLKEQLGYINKPRTNYK